MMFAPKLGALFSLVLCVSQATAHYVFPSLVVNGVTTTPWENVRKTNNYYSHNPVTDVKSADFRCYDTETNAKASTIKVAAGSQLGIMSDGTIAHPGVVNVYMAKASGDVSNFKGDGNVWFKVYEEAAVADGNTITWPKSYTWEFSVKGIYFDANVDQPGITFTVPKSLPNGQYLGKY
ncbi:hypothetical protein VNI00_006662 [Paramarasmius palmivorus]|uniref:lytic cellulose monooxygenase (C4-dehydrogenating) n=1 Tax=Paramarasmius palmivorus TaxID=297713 RepID=A0AAW0D548_9AGAR